MPAAAYSSPVKGGDGNDWVLPLEARGPGVRHTPVDGLLGRARGGASPETAWHSQNGFHPDAGGVAAHPDRPEREKPAPRVQPERLIDRESILGNIERRYLDKAPAELRPATPRPAGRESAERKSLERKPEPERDSTGAQPVTMDMEDIRRRLMATYRGKLPDSEVQESTDRPGETPRNTVSGPRRGRVDAPAEKIVLPASASMEPGTPVREAARRMRPVSAPGGSLKVAVSSDDVLAGPSSTPRESRPGRTGGGAAPPLQTPPSLTRPSLTSRPMAPHPPVTPSSPASTPPVAPITPEIPGTSDRTLPVGDPGSMATGTGATSASESERAPEGTLDAAPAGAVLRDEPVAVSAPRADEGKDIILPMPPHPSATADSAAVTPSGLLLLTGPSQAESTHADQSQTEPSRTEPSWTEPHQTELRPAEPSEEGEGDVRNTRELPVERHALPESQRDVPVNPPASGLAAGGPAPCLLPEPSEPSEPSEPLEPPAHRAPGSRSNPFRPRYHDLMCLPALSLLHPADPAVTPMSQDDLIAGGILIEEKLAEFRVKVNVQDAYAGPVITRYEIQPAVGVRGGQVVSLMKDLARALGVAAIRVLETIPGKTCMGLELPNPRRQLIHLSEVLSSEVFQGHASKLAVVLGKDITGEPVVVDLARAPHLLVAGTTGSGKSVGVNAMILSLLYRATPDEVRFVMIDPKMLELSFYDGIPHLLAPVVTDMKLAANALNWCVGEMERRYRLMTTLRVRNLAGYNQKVREAADAGEPLPDPFALTPEDAMPLSPLPCVVVVVDELADLMMVAGKKIEELIARLAQKARAAGIHLILATQRPSVDVITGLIKANIPTRIAFQVSSKIDSRTILDQMGAECLLGQGDMLYLPPGSGYPQRVHGAFVSDEEVYAVAEHLKGLGEPDYVEDVLGPAVDAEEGTTGAERFGDESDPLYDEAVAFVISSRRASISAVQRQLRIGYNRAARMVEQMEAEGLVSPMESNGNRKVLAPPEQE